MIPDRYGNQWFAVGEVVRITASPYAELVGQDGFVQAVVDKPGQRFGGFYSVYGFKPYPVDPLESDKPCWYYGDLYGENLQCVGAVVWPAWLRQYRRRLTAPLDVESIDLTLRHLGEMTRTPSREPFIPSRPDMSGVVEP